jgi:hypothetical protein
MRAIGDLIDLPKDDELTWEEKYKEGKRKVKANRKFDSDTESEDEVQYTIQVQVNSPANTKSKKSGRK